MRWPIRDVQTRLFSLANEEALMRRRLYYVMPDYASARRTMDDLLLARIEVRHIHFLAKRGTPMDGLHEANVLQATDIVHGAKLGTAMGAALGCIAGALLIWFPPTDGIPQVVAVLGATIGGAAFGAWTSSMAAASIPNSRLKRFASAIEAGRILLMVDVPERQVEEIHALLHRSHPEAANEGMEPNIPAFP
jgi:hypothetical protein